MVWITYGLLWCFYQLFWLSFWWHPFTAEDPLVNKWWNAKFLQICSDEETNSSTSWMAWGWVNTEQIFIFGWTTPVMYQTFTAWPLNEIYWVCWHTELFCSIGANKQTADSVAQRTSGATQLASGRADLPSLNPLIKALLNCQKLQKANKTAAAAKETVSLHVQILKKVKNKLRWTEHVHVWSL